MGMIEEHLATGPQTRFAIAARNRAVQQELADNIHMKHAVSSELASRRARSREDWESGTALSRMADRHAKAAGYDIPKGSTFEEENNSRNQEASWRGQAYERWGR